MYSRSCSNEWLESRSKVEWPDYRRRPYPPRLQGPLRSTKKNALGSWRKAKSKRGRQGWSPLWCGGRFWGAMGLETPRQVWGSGCVERTSGVALSLHPGPPLFHEHDESGNSASPQRAGRILRVGGDMRRQPPFMAPHPYEGSSASLHPAPTRVWGRRVHEPEYIWKELLSGRNGVFFNFAIYFCVPSTAVGTDE